MSENSVYYPPEILLGSTIEKFGDPNTAIVFWSGYTNGFKNDRIARDYCEEMNNLQTVIPYRTLEMTPAGIVLQQMLDGDNKDLVRLTSFAAHRLSTHLAENITLSFVATMVNGTNPLLCTFSDAEAHAIMNNNYVHEIHALAPAIDKNGSVVRVHSTILPKNEWYYWQRWQWVHSHFKELEHLLSSGYDNDLPLKKLVLPLLDLRLSQLNIEKVKKPDNSYTYVNTFEEEQMYDYVMQGLTTTFFELIKYYDSQKAMAILPSWSTSHQLAIAALAQDIVMHSIPISG